MGILPMTTCHHRQDADATMHSQSRHCCFELRFLRSPIITALFEILDDLRRRAFRILEIIG